jgi:hypothetical protein
MRSLLVTVILLPIMILLGFTGCTDKVEMTHTYVKFSPVTIRTDDLRSAVAVEAPRPLQTSGKIYYRAPYLFINEPGEGIHIIDNSNPASPVNLSFVTIPGNYDMAVVGDYLYADSYIDLLTLDIGNPQQVELINREENVFPMYNSWMPVNETSPVIITEWTEETVTDTFIGDADEIADGVWQRSTNTFFPQIFVAMDDMASMSTAESMMTSAGPQVGTGGSMARFAATLTNLYAVNDHQLNVFSLQDKSNPEAGTTIDIGWGVETIFPFKENLFIGSQQGMYIYNIANADQPEYVSEFRHMRACDPVVANDSLAYVTLREGNACVGAQNQLDVINIEEITNPWLVESYSMNHPHGLAISGNTLFICEGAYGLKVYDATNPRAISSNQLAHFTNIHAYDVIPIGNVIMLIGDDGLYQYDFSDPTDIRLLSTLDFVTL